MMIHSIVPLSGTPKECAIAGRLILTIEGRHECTGGSEQQHHPFIRLLPAARTFCWQVFALCRRDTCFAFRGHFALSHCIFPLSPLFRFASNSLLVIKPSCCFPGNFCSFFTVVVACLPDSSWVVRDLSLSIPAGASFGLRLATWLLRSWRRARIVLSTRFTSVCAALPNLTFEASPREPTTRNSRLERRRSAMRIRSQSAG